MLSFEEFFIKKKIDLFALKSANQELYDEFEIHYHAMGEKSFDHSKKFWFNKLRKRFLLNEAAVVPKNNTSFPTSSSGQNDGIISKDSPDAASKPAGFKPRFKAAVTKTVETSTEDTSTETRTDLQENKIEESAASAGKPTGFKPRFKAGITKNTPPTDTKS